MSYAAKGREVRAGAEVLLANVHRQESGAGTCSACSSDGDVSYFEDFRKVQETVKSLHQQASDIRKEACLVGTAAFYLGNKSKLQDGLRTAKSQAGDAKRLLQCLGDASSGGTASERDLRRLTLQKLRQNLMDATKGLEVAWKQYEAAAAEASRCHGSVQGMPAESSSPGLELGQMVREVREADIEEARLGGSQLRALEDVTQAEIDTHVDVAEELASEVRSIEQDIKGLQRVFVDLAEHTHYQGEMLENIEANMVNAVQQTENATEQVVAASRKQSLRNKCWIRLLVFVFVLTVLVILYAAHMAS